MRLLHESTVAPEEIDSLGHMNVRYYMARMEQANRRLISELGLPQATQDNAMLGRVDTYTRFRNEQFEGANLHTVGGILTLGEGGMQSYIEVRNPDTEQTAATFIVTTTLLARETRQAMPFPAPANVPSETVEVPEYAQPRSLQLDAVNTEVDIETLDRLVPNVEGGGMMSGRRSTTVEPDDVDDSGWLRADIEVMFLPFMKMAQQSGTTQGPPVFHTEDGRRVGWAVMESRNMLFGQARLNDELAYFSADIGIAAKSRHSRRWAFNQNTGQLLGISDTVGLCIDLDARRAIEWPEELRKDIEAHQLPQLA